jgi:hypothetical protein
MLLPSMIIFVAVKSKKSFGTYAFPFRRCAHHFFIISLILRRPVADIFRRPRLGLLAPKLKLIGLSFAPPGLRGAAASPSASRAAIALSSQLRSCFSSPRIALVFIAGDYTKG